MIDKSKFLDSSLMLQSSLSLSHSFLQCWSDVFYSTVRLLLAATVHRSYYVPQITPKNHTTNDFKCSAEKCSTIAAVVVLE